MRALFSAICLSLALIIPLPAPAMNTWGTDLSDLWWNPNENGWGATITHQQEIIFMNIYVYGPDGKARWYSASAMASQGGANAYVFTGALFETNGPFYGSAFNPANVFVRQVGSATLTFVTADLGSLSYSVDGVAVSKTITRLTVRNNNLTGSYVGAYAEIGTGCPQSGYFADTARFTVNHVGNGISISSTTGAGSSCTYSGTYSQSGRMGSIDGTAVCNGVSSTFTAYEIEAGYQGLFLKYEAHAGSCSITGRLGGMKF